MAKKKIKTGEMMTDDDLLNLMGEVEQYCDDCGEVLVSTLKSPIVVFAVLPFNVSSANKGESGCICGACHKKHLATKYWENNDTK